MKKYFSIYLLFLAIFLVSARVNVTEAKSVTYSNTAFPTDGCFGINMSYSVSYKANLYNDSAGGVLLNDGDVISTGTQIRFQDGPYIDSDISWFGTGWTSSSPYGTWGLNANKPTADKFSAYSELGIAAHQGVLSVNPPINFTVSHTGSAGLSCNGAGTVCTVASPGTINAIANFTNSPAEGIVSLDNGCNEGWFPLNQFEFSLGYPNPVVPLPTTYANNINFWGAYGQGWLVPPPNPYVLSNYDYSSATYRTTTGIPSQTIPFTLTAVAVGNPPNAPTIVGPTTGITDTAYTFTLTGTDPDGDTIRYGLDWNSDNLVDQQIPPSTGVPSTDYVPSGTEQSVDHTWLSTGTYTFQALTQDINSGSSGWTTHTITIDTLPTCTSIPANTVVCTGDEVTGFTGSIASSLQEFSTSCTLPQRCEYLCAQGYLYSAGTCTPTQCNDGMNNDVEDALIDMADPGCENNITNNDEFNLPENPVVSVDRRTVVKDDTVTLTWDTNNGNESLCTLTAFSGGPNLITADGEPNDPNTGSQNVTIPARSTYTLSCPNPLGGTPLTDTVSVDIVPVGTET